MNNATVWKLAAGSCGFNVGTRKVYGAYVNGVALFSWVDTTLSEFFFCSVTGHLTTGGYTREAAQSLGERYARENGREEADRVLSRAQFEKTMNDPTRLT